MQPERLILRGKKICFIVCKPKHVFNLQTDQKTHCIENIYILHCITLKKTFAKEVCLAPPACLFFFLLLFHLHSDLKSSTKLKL